MKRKTEIGFSALILLGLIYYLALPEEFLALALAVIVHELGHAAAIWLLGLNICRLRADFKGFCISYFGDTSAAGHIFIAFAGPAAGILYALAASYYAQKLESGLLYLSSGISLMLSFFNMLPACPLDGGRIMGRLTALIAGERRGGRICAAISFACAVGLFILGLWFLINKRGAALLTASVWLLFYQEDGLGIVKSREIL